MKKSYIVALASVFAIMALSAFTTADSNMRKLFLTLLGPYLPDTPYDYSIKLPPYIVDQVFWVQQNASAVENSISDQKATLGRVLFYDKVLSKNFLTSCATCHKQAHGFTENKKFSKAIGGQPVSRNTPSINDLAWRMSYSPWTTLFFWDAREDNFHEMVTTPITNPDEMGLLEADIVPRLQATGYYDALFETAYGEPGIDIEKTREALVQFIKSMTTFDSKYDKVKGGEANFTAEEAAGEALFMQHCNTCHAAPHFGVATPLRNGFPILSDPGYGAITNEGIDLGKFKSPSLRNIALTSPYMHNGKYEDLAHVLKFYADSVSTLGQYYNQNGESLDIGAIELNTAEIAEMTAFLGTLTSSTLATHPKWSDPFVLALSTSDHDDLATVKIYPNPISATLNIEIIGMDSQLFELEFHGQDGKLLRKEKLASKSETLQKGDLLPGVYWLKIIGETQTVTQSLIIQ